MCYSVYVRTPLCVYDINLFKRMVHIAVNGKCYTTPQQPSLLSKQHECILPDNLNSLLFRTGWLPQSRSPSSPAKLKLNS